MLWNNPSVEAEGNTVWSDEDKYKGEAATINIGTVVAVNQGSEGVENVGSSTHATLNFKLPKGAKGEQGVQGLAGVISIGSVSTGVAGSSVIIENVGSPQNAVLNITIPQGIQGDTGSKGWSPVFAVISDGVRRVLKVSDWQGGEGTKPVVDVYMGAAGYTHILADAVDIKGDTGATGSVGAGVVSGGTANQLLYKLDGADYNTGWKTITKSDVGLSNVDNTSDVNKPISTATQTALNAKQNTLTVVPALINGVANTINIGSTNTTNTGGNNQIYGLVAGASLTTGANNIAQGYSAGRANTTGNSWIAQGYNAGRANTTGNFWTAQGSNAGYNNTVGSNWIAQGTNAGYSNTTGTGWIAQGTNAGRENTTGNYWVAQGYNAGSLTSTGNLTVANNTVHIGYNSKSLNNNASNEIVIGANAVGNGNNTVTLGDTNITGTYLRKPRIIGTLTDSTGSAGTVGTVLASGGTSAGWTNLKTINDTSLIGTGNIPITSGKLAVMTSPFLLVNVNNQGNPMYYNLEMGGTNTLGATISNGRLVIPTTGVYDFYMEGRPDIRNEGGIYGVFSYRIQNHTTNTQIADNDCNFVVNGTIGLWNKFVSIGNYLTAGTEIKVGEHMYMNSDAGGYVGAHTVTLKIIAR